MSRSRPPLEQGSLFDFELDSDEDEEREAVESREEPAEAAPSEGKERARTIPEETPSALDVPLDRTEGGSLRDPITSPGAPAASEERSEVPEAGARFLAGGLDAAVHLLLAAGVVGLLALLGIPLGPRTLGAVVVVVLVFSFFYAVVSLAFWGATLGMKALDLVAETDGGGPLAFGQATRRWLGGVLTVGSAGLPGLLVLSGRSLGDRLSGSRLIQH